MVFQRIPHCRISKNVGNEQQFLLERKRLFRNCSIGLLVIHIVFITAALTDITSANKCDGRIVRASNVKRNGSRQPKQWIIVGPIKNCRTFDRYECRMIEQQGFGSFIDSFPRHGGGSGLHLTVASLWRSSGVAREAAWERLLMHRPPKLCWSRSRW